MSNWTANRFLFLFFSQKNPLVCRRTFALLRVAFMGHGRSLQQMWFSESFHRSSRLVDEIRILGKATFFSTKTLGRGWKFLLCKNLQAKSHGWMRGFSFYHSPTHLSRLKLKQFNARSSPHMRCHRLRAVAYRQSYISKSLLQAPIDSKILPISQAGSLKVIWVELHRSAPAEEEKTEEWRSRLPAWWMRWHQR